MDHVREGIPRLVVLVQGENLVEPLNGSYFKELFAKSLMVAGHIRAAAEMDTSRHRAAMVGTTSNSDSTRTDAGNILQRKESRTIQQIKQKYSHAVVKPMQ